MRRLLIVGVLGSSFALAPPSTASGQRLTPEYMQGQSAAAARTVPIQSASPAADDAGMVLAGLAFGAGGLVLGGYAGSALGGGNRVCGDDPCGFEEAVWGAAAGVSVAIPLGVHLANRGRGSYGLELATSLGIAATGMALAFTVNNGIPVIAIPVAQLVASVVIERRTGN